MEDISSDHYVYGPVPSRRLGLSLGVDLLPYKVCCFDCLYCQVGRTTRLPSAPEDFGVAVEEVVAQVQQALADEPRVEVITFAGSGEPTLYGPLQELVQALRRVCDLPLVLLTNGALLWRPEVLEAALLFDQVYPSLDAADERTLRGLNRPAPELTLDLILGGLEDFCGRFKGPCRLEVMLVHRVNDSAESLAALADLARKLDIDGVDLNTVVRPPSYRVKPLTADAMQAAAEHFEGLDVKIIARFSGEHAGGATPDEETTGQILEMTARRPCTAADIAASMDLASEALDPLLARLVAAGDLLQEGEFYRTVSRS